MTFNMRRDVLAIAAILILVFSTTCTNPLAGTLRESVQDANEASIEFYPDYPTLARDTVLQIYFGKPMIRESLEIDGPMSESCIAEWMVSVTDGSSSNTMLSIAPIGLWPLNDDIDITIRCTDTDGYVAEITSLPYGVINEAVYVSPAGDDENSGTMDRPIRSIAEAERRLNDIVLNWTDLEVRTINLAEGEYPEFGLNHYAGLTLSGGWKSDWTTQDSDIYTSVIRPDFQNIESPQDGLSAFRIVSQDEHYETRVEHLTLNIQNPTFDVTGMMVSDTDAVVEDVSIVAYGAGFMYGMMLAGLAEPLILGCDIRAEACDTFIGIAGLATSTQDTRIESCRVQTINCNGAQGLFAMYNSVIVENCDFDIQGSTRVEGLYFTNGTGLVRNTVVVVEATDPGYSPVPLRISFSRMTLQNCTIVYPRFGFVALDRSNPILQNNLFVHQPSSPAWSDHAAYFAASADSDPDILESSHFSGTDRIYLFADGSGSYGLFADTQIGDMETGLIDMGREASGNTVTTADETAFFTSEWDLLGSVPAAISGGGTNISSQYTFDKAGRSRPASGAWSVGAYELP